MFVASSENRKELYKLSKWGDEMQVWYDEWPPYTLGYLLRKLPKTISKDNEHRYCLSLEADDTDWWADYSFYDSVLAGEYATTLEDAVAKLCISLIKQDILPPQSTKEQS